MGYLVTITYDAGKYQTNYALKPKGGTVVICNSIIEFRIRQENLGLVGPVELEHVTGDPHLLCNLLNVTWLLSQCDITITEKWRMRFDYH